MVNPGVDEGDRHDPTGSVPPVATMVDQEGSVSPSTESVPQRQPQRGTTGRRLLVLQFEVDLVTSEGDARENSRQADADELEHMGVPTTSSMMRSLASFDEVVLECAFEIRASVMKTDRSRCGECSGERSRPVYRPSSVGGRGMILMRK